MNAYRRHILTLLRPLMASRAPLGRVLDFGSGPGWFAHTLQEERLASEIVAVDIERRDRCYVEPILYDGQQLPFKNRSFDMVYSVDVLHHCTSPRASLKELLRCADKYVLLKDHTYRKFLSRLFLCLLDELGNRRFGVRCLYNYQHGWEWFRWIEQEGFVLEQLIHPAFCHTSLLGRQINRFEFVALWRRQN